MSSDTLCLLFQNIISWNRHSDWQSPHIGFLTCRRRPQTVSYQRDDLLPKQKVKIHAKSWVIAELIANTEYLKDTR